jgi:single-strand DNA-binding protein
MIPKILQSCHKLLTKREFLGYTESSQALPIISYQEGNMVGLNRVQLIGHLGKDPELKELSGGKKVCEFSVAVNRRWKTNSGEYQESTEWFNVEAWERLAEICSEYLNKGSLVYLEGRFQTDTVETDGGNRYYTKVVASQMQMLDRKVPQEA